MINVGVMLVEKSEAKEVRTILECGVTATPFAMFNSTFVSGGVFGDTA